MPSAEVDALAGLRKALKAIGSTEGLNEIKQANIAIAGVILDKARPGIAAVSSTVAAAATVVKSVAQPAIRVTGPRAGGTIFGAYHNVERRRRSGRYKGYNQFRTFKADAYSILPESDTVDEQIADAYVKAVDHILDQAGVPRG